MARILVTGFEPFGRVEGNSSAAVVERLATAPPPKVELGTAVLPVTFHGSWPALRRALHAQPAPPAAVLLLGQAAGRSRVEVERVAINVADTVTGDNAGAAPQDEPVVAGGAAGIFATIPVRRVLTAMIAAGTPAAISSSAGTYVCNALLYRALAELHVPVGFIHLPLLPEQADGSEAPTLSLEEMVTGVTAALAVLGTDADAAS